jgi:hypothetical protein
MQQEITQMPDHGFDIQNIIVYLIIAQIRPNYIAQPLKTGGTNNLLNGEHC